MAPKGVTKSGSVMWVARYCDPDPDPATIPYADGGTCPAYKCGYGHDENGNPNPSSGEIQTKNGCDAGYINDPELCASVADIEVP